MEIHVWTKVLLVLIGSMAIFFVWCAINNFGEKP